MRRAFLPSVATAALALAPLMTGCGGPKSDEAAPPDANASATPPRSGNRPAVPEEYVDAGNLPGRTHVVQPRDTLYSLAQQYYGNRNQWRRIYQANQKRLSDPNNLPVGMRLIIP